MIWIFLGAPGAGKGTQADRLADHLMSTEVLEMQTFEDMIQKHATQKPPEKTRNVRAGDNGRPGAEGEAEPPARDLGDVPQKKADLPEPTGTNPA